MSKIIALKSGLDEIFPDAWDSDFSNLKQQALFFDRIGFYKLNKFYADLNESLHLWKKSHPEFQTDKGETILRELEWLQEQNLIFELKLEELGRPEFIPANMGEQFEDTKALLRRILEIEFTDPKSIKNKTHRVELFREQRLMILRFMAIVMEKTKGVTTVTTFPYTEYARKVPNSRKADVAQIVINRLPLPNNETSWEQIIDYRNDPENQNNLLGLRHWIRKISKEELSKAEIEDEIEWRINEFQNHMKLHKMKANTETLEAVVKAPLEIIENLIKLKFSKIPEPFFALKKRQINLLEAELNAPSKEISYIIKTREAFQTQE